ncbi:glycosyltransferase family 2 protein [Paraburkholderia tuberum]|uniref:glycosyltransferase family 2 protein n=1 Tax=Paraburkholderia TaxID=1822464 RepID=UPI00036B5A0E|nr:glycosyltransferase family A protein [Paraburkholderia tuberum]
MQKITIVICNYNHGRFLADAIDSSLSQDYPETRVLVIDDGSTDGSREIAECYAGRIQALYRENGGQVSAYNDAVNMIDTEFVILLDSDDLLYKGAVSEVMQAFEAGDSVKVQFRLDVVDSAGKPTGTYVPHSAAPVDCGSLLRRGWLYPSPPASGNAYRTSALKKIFPVPEASSNRYGADFYAIYGVALLGAIATIPKSLGAYRVHRTKNTGIDFANSDSTDKAPRALTKRWSILRQMARSRLGIELPPSFHDFSLEKAYFCSAVYQASFAKRWGWVSRQSHGYLRSIVANPFWSYKKKIGTLALSSLCLLPCSPLSDFAVRYISNPLARRRL